jgi:hypothetical protein
MVYKDMKDPATKEVERHIQDCEADKAAKQYLESLVGSRANYALCGQNCRDFSGAAFDHLSGGE